MTKKKSGLLITITAVLVLCIGLSVFLSSCDGKKESTDNTQTEYTVVVRTVGGMPLSEISVYVYEDADKEDLVWKADTDEEGKISFKAPVSENYVAFLQGVPEGYNAEEHYSLNNGLHTDIVLDTVLLDGSDLSAYTYELGSVVRDFTVTSIDGTEYNVGDLLKENKAVVLNFWFINCGPCKMEFPYLQQAYEEFSDEIEVLALNPVDGTDTTISEFAQELGLTFPMFSCDAEWESCMQLTAYPTTVIIDRYGTISMIHKGSITDKETFVKMFEYFTSDDYVQTTVRNISDIEDDERS